MPRILIELTDEEWALLRADAKRARRTPQAQGAVLLSDLLGRRLNPKGLSPETLALLTERSTAAEAQAAVGGAGLPLAPGEQVDPVQGHRNGPGGGVGDVVVPAAGEAE